ncbi:hypothetical protein DdX_22380 [Ditylenchus destructor]|uniref:Uncharacterized protein n=1 Tax=Ditylenchus destructor TaxID=166010 RepID=A0AAD4MEB0_9BILA|nr:hypothetical protein DdX_22380 [Ditylenchus destructor]
MASMQLKCNLTKCRDMDVYLDDSDIESHISAKHLSYLPLKCTWCEEENQDHFCATREDIKKHTSINHNGKNARYSVFEDDAKEDELKKLAKECRCSAIPQIISNDSKIALRRVLNVLGGSTSIANVAENGLQVKQENHDDVIVIEDDNDSAAVPNSSDGNVLEQLPEQRVERIAIASNGQNEQPVAHPNIGAENYEVHPADVPEVKPSVNISIVEDQTNSVTTKTAEKAKKRRRSARLTDKQNAAKRSRLNDK